MQTKNTRPMSPEMQNLYAVNRLVKRKKKLQVVLADAQNELDTIDGKIRQLLLESGLLGDNLSVQPTQTQLVTFTRGRITPRLDEKIVELLKTETTGLSYSTIARKIDANYLSVYNLMRNNPLFACEKPVGSACLLWTLAKK